MSSMSYGCALGKYKSLESQSFLGEKGSERSFGRDAGYSKFMRASTFSRGVRSRKRCSP